jgi:hypothetical protein
MSALKIIGPCVWCPPALLMLIRRLARHSMSSTPCATPPPGPLQSGGPTQAASVPSKLGPFLWAVLTSPDDATLAASHRSIVPNIWSQSVVLTP